MWAELARSLQQGNGYVITIMILGFLALVVLFERLLMLQLVYHVDFSKFLANLKKMVAAEDLDRAVALCKNTSATSLPHIALKALEAAETDPTKIRGTIEEEAIDFLPNIERRLGVLPAFAVMIALIGVLGTIDALWRAFQAVDILDSAKKQATLAQGVASALNPTALAILFAVTLLAGYYLVKGMALTLVERVHYGVAVLTNLLAPQEALNYMPMAADAGVSPVATGAEPPSGDFAPAKADAQSQPEERFDDVSVEDIKDEEEII